MPNKKFFLPLTTLFLLSLLTSCNGSSNEEVALYYADQTLEDVVTLTDDGQLASLVEDEANFVLVSPGNNSCTCWSAFHNNVLIPYIKDKGTTIYSMALSTFGEEDYGIDLRDDRPTLAIFHYGKLIYNKVYSESDYIFSHKQYFIDWFEQIVITPTISKIDKDDLTNLYKGTTPFTIYFGRDNCPDCGYFEKHNLAKYIETYSPTKEMYYINLNVEGIMLDESQEMDTEQYIDFKDTFGMSEINNPTFGYNAGYVPTILYVEPNGILPSIDNNVIKSGIVIYNDTIAINAENKYVVSDSYFTESRVQNLSYLDTFSGTKILEGLILQESQVTVYEEYDNYIKWNYDNSSTYFAPLAYAFLDAYFK
jgi:hypothetical protein